MPWDGTELWLAQLAGDAQLRGRRLVAGGPEESVFQPSFSPSGQLHFVSDRSGWWNLYADRDGTVEAIAPVDAELGVPQWVFGLSTYAFVPDGPDGTIAARHRANQVGRSSGHSIRHQPSVIFPARSFLTRGGSR